MKITIDLPDDTKCATISYVFGDTFNLKMAVENIDTDDINKAKEAQND